MQSSKNTAKKEMTDKLIFESFSSGSCGNCYYLGNGTDGILIDAGVSLRRLKKYLADMGLSYDSFSCVLVTHAHLDHIRHLGAFCKRLRKPVFTTAEIHDTLSRHSFTMDHIGPCRRDLEVGVWTAIRPEISVRPFVVPHDANQTVGYSVDFGGYKFVIMTDIGRMTDEAVCLAREARTVVIESNYDIDMLMSGPYPHELKMRICEGCGHLSNDECASALKRIVNATVENVFLCHRSENNNTSKLAYDCARAALVEIGMGDVSLRVLPREYPSPEFVLMDKSAE